MKNVRTSKAGFPVVITDLNGCDAPCNVEITTLLACYEETPALLPVGSCTFEAGMCYLFSTEASSRSLSDILWAIVDRKTENGILLEISTFDLMQFGGWSYLPATYGYARRMTSDEMRDFCYNLGFSEASKLH